MNESILQVKGSMFNIADNALATISPRYPAPPCGASRFRWRMHCALPFVIPSGRYVQHTFEREGRQFRLEYLNHVDRLTILPKQPQGIPGVFLVPKLKDGEVEPPVQGNLQHFREHLQSAASIVELTEYSIHDEAFTNAEKKIQDGFEVMAEHLASMQRSLPFLVAWTIYPVSLFDIGVVHHAVEHFCRENEQWKMMGCAVALSLAKQLRAPLFVTDLNTLPAEPADLSLAYELLSEAQLSIFRRLPRLAVLNSFTALETLANSVFRQLYKTQLVKWGVPESHADIIAERARKSHRSDERFLLGEGAKQASGRSLLEENKSLYDELMALEEHVRHQVAHRGVRPTLPEAKACYKACCEGVRWLSQVAGQRVKEMMPPKESLFQGFVAGSAAPHVCTETEMEVLRRMFAVVHTPSEGRTEE